MSNIKTLQGTAVRKISVVRPTKLDNSDSDSDPEPLQTNRSNVANVRPSVERNHTLTIKNGNNELRTRKISCVRPVKLADVAVEFDIEKETPKNKSDAISIPFTIPNSRKSSGLRAPKLSELDVEEFEARQATAKQEDNTSLSSCCSEDNETSFSKISNEPSHQGYQIDSDYYNENVSTPRERRPLRRRKVSKFPQIPNTSDVESMLDKKPTGNHTQGIENNAFDPGRKVKFKINKHCATESDQEDEYRNRSKSEIPDVLKMMNMETVTETRYGSIDSLMKRWHTTGETHTEPQRLKVHIPELECSGDEHADHSSSESENDTEQEEMRQRTDSPSLYRCNHDVAERDLKKYIIKLQLQKRKSSQVCCLFAR